MKMEENGNNKNKPEDIQPDENFNQSPDWMFMIDGCKTDIRKEPREFQEQAYYSGMIPFIPADYPKQGKVKEEFENNIRIIEFSTNTNKKTEFESISE
jgi:hypothetical protein